MFIINGIGVVLMFAVVALFYAIGYNHGKSDGREETAKKYVNDLREVMSQKDIPGAY
jgi:hypothetical protein